MGLKKFILSKLVPIVTATVITTAVTSIASINAEAVGGASDSVKANENGVIKIECVYGDDNFLLRSCTGFIINNSSVITSKEILGRSAESILRDQYGSNFRYDKSKLKYRTKISGIYINATDALDTTDTDNAFAVLRLGRAIDFDKSSYKALSLGSSSSLSTTETVYTIGYSTTDNNSTVINEGKISKFSIKTNIDKDKKFMEESIDKINREASNKYKGKINHKSKENKIHFNEMNLSYDNNKIRNVFIDDNKIIKKKESNLLKKSFRNLRFTHPQRFSYHSANKKSNNAKKLQSNYFISLETNISIISPLIKKRKYSNEKTINQNNLNDKTKKVEDKNLVSYINEKTDNLIQKNTETNDFSEKTQVQENSHTFAKLREKKLFNFNGLSNNSINIINESIKNRINHLYNKNKTNNSINKNTFINKLDNNVKNTNENNRMDIDEDNSIISKNQKDNNIFLGKENFISSFVKSNDKINFSYKSKKENNNKLNEENLKFSFGK